MRFHHIAVLLVTSLFLSGFDSQKTEVLVKRCVDRGNSEETCRCVLRVQEEALGTKFIEAAYLQVIGDLTGYEMKLREIVKEDPRAIDTIAELDTRVKQRCALR